MDLTYPRTPLLGRHREPHSAADGASTMAAVSFSSDNTIGIVHWDAMGAGIDGEQLSLIIPAFFQSHHVPYLNDILASRFRDLFGDTDVKFRLDPGKWTRTDTSSSYEPGDIIITGIREPWPDGDALREALDTAFNEAGAVEAEQMRRADELVRHLRETGRRWPQTSRGRAQASGCNRRPGTSRMALSTGATLRAARTVRVLPRGAGGGARGKSCPVSGPRCARRLRYGQRRAACPSRASRSIRGVRRLRGVPTNDAQGRDLLLAHHPLPPTSGRQQAHRLRRHARVPRGATAMSSSIPSTCSTQRG